MGPLIPLFWTSGDICPGFQSQGGSLLHAFSLTSVILIVTSDVIPADCIEVSMTPKPFWSTYLQTYLLALVVVWGVNQWLSMPLTASTTLYTTRPLRLGGLGKILIGNQTDGLPVLVRNQEWAVLVMDNKGWALLTILFLLNYRCSINYRSSNHIDIENFHLSNTLLLNVKFKVHTSKYPRKNRNYHLWSQFNFA